jgi:hypothetical protein
MEEAACGTVAQHEGNLPLLLSLPLVATQKILPARTVNGTAFEDEPFTLTTMLPVEQFGPS